MDVRFRLTVLALVVLWGTTAGVESGWSGPREVEVSDSARAELSAKRYWHAARAMRAEGVADGTPDEVFLLASAEAGWENWPAVLELLEGADWLGENGADSASYLLGRAL